MLVEPLVEHKELAERFVALERTVNGVEITQSLAGGVNVEDAPQKLQKFVSSEPHNSEALKEIFEDSEFIATLVNCFEDNHFTYLEINPYIAQGDRYAVLDAAVEVDTSAEFFVNNNWSAKDTRTYKTNINEAEKAVDALAEKSPASLALKVLNENGSIFLLLSGGGASVVIADEFSSLGCHEQMANYGEYSGNPNEEETYLYTKQVLRLLLKSTAEKKVLLIAGGTANFTDIAVTFKGIIHALSDDAEALKNQDVAVYVRRGGPNQVKGLKLIQDYLNQAGLVNGVYGPEESLGSIVTKVVKRLEA